jgi:hypothetical protein
MATEQSDAKFYRTLISVGVGALIMVAEFLGELSLRLAFHSGWRDPQMAMAANSVGGVVGGLLVYKLLSFEAERQYLRKELNHEIRNALQPIIYSTPTLRDSERQIIEASVIRIETCLKESLLTETPPVTHIKQTVH